MSDKYRCNLDKVMTEQGRTNVWLANLIGTSQQSISTWRGGKLPKSEFMQPIAAALGVTVGYLFFDESVDKVEYSA